MIQGEFRRRTKELGLDVLRLAGELPRNRPADIIVRQLIRSATSVGENYRAACRGRSTADVISKLGVVLEEADETLYWLELLHESGLAAGRELERLSAEADEIVAMTVASIKTLKSRPGRDASQP